MAHATLTISSKNYSSWSLRAWLLCKMAKLEFDEELVPIDDPTVRAELLLLSPSVLVPRLTHEGASVWDTLAIAEYLAELRPEAELWPKERAARAHCRAISGEMHSGFYNMRSALPMNLKMRPSPHKIFAGAKPDIERVISIWTECLDQYGGPFLFGKETIADALYAPVCTRFMTYGVALNDAAARYRDHILAWPLMVEWIDAAQEEPEEIDELDVEF